MNLIHYLSKGLRHCLYDWEHHCRRGRVGNEHREDSGHSHEPHQDEGLVVADGLKSKSFEFPTFFGPQHWTDLGS